MKFIAAQSFSQGLQNPLKTANGLKHVEKGTVMELDAQQLELKDVKFFLSASQLVPVESQRGKEVQAECDKAAAFDKAEAKARRPQINWGAWAVVVSLVAILAAILIYIAQSFLSR